MYAFPDFINVQAPLGMDIAMKPEKDELCDYLVKDLPKSLDQDRLESILEEASKRGIRVGKCFLVLDVVLW